MLESWHDRGEMIVGEGVLNERGRKAIPVMDYPVDCGGITYW